ncbi:aldo/keto reductase [Salimicrobium humidisoli]|uniref:D-threo-aldose 1-dehydrogenase n=1 Tax=Salimicrobium humidisoli TaxID=2029857 RepID=A0ABX4HUR0_9BACI|nr:aldo/keto reductase [Salimicrobium humidisoli]PBB06572.1 D-threo-aldose 1-dehydrogenase [Salimicrobium humidisoli]
MKLLNKAVKHGAGLGTAPLGNMYRDVSEEEAFGTIQSAWNMGIRYFDTAPHYGAGLAEIRLGKALADKPRDDFFLSTKVGRYMKDSTEEKEGLFKYGRQNEVVTDYSGESTRISIEQSLERLQTDRLDVVFVHDVSPDFHGDAWTEKFEQARSGAFHVLEEMKKKGTIKGWGLGVNTISPIKLALEMGELIPDIFLTATQYTLLQHEHALQEIMPLAEEKQVEMVVGSPYNSGALLGGSYFDYEAADANVLNHVRQLKQIADEYNVSLKAAGLQFSSAHPAVSAVIPGSTKAEHVEEDLRLLQEEIPKDFWKELISKGFISEKAPLPV